MVSGFFAEATDSAGARAKSLALHWTAARSDGGYRESPGQWEGSRPCPCRISFPTVDPSETLSVIEPMRDCAASVTHQLCHAVASRLLWHLGSTPLSASSEPIIVRLEPLRP